MNQDTLHKAIAHWGKQRQVAKAQEECLELSLALAHYWDGRASHAQVVTEVADVLIMAQQMRLVFGPEAVDAEVDRKSVV